MKDNYFAEDNAEKFDLQNGKIETLAFARDKNMAMSPARKHKKAQNQRIGQRSDSDLHHGGSNTPTRVSIKSNRGNFGKGTKNE